MSSVAPARRFGIPASTAAAQLQRDDADLATQPFQPLPSPTGASPYRLELSSVLGTQPASLSLHVIGDHGGVKDPTPQAAVASALIADHAANPVSACYSVGDVVYFNGAESEYPNQFGEPYAHYNVPIVAIPGNHDGDPGRVGEAESSGEPSLAAFMRHFCDTTPRLLPDMAEFQRDTMDQPNCYFTLRSPQATIIGLYSNVPSGGVIRSDQAQWLVGELSAAPTNVPLIVALHHAPLSVDAHHGGSARMGAVLDQAFRSAERCPQLVLAGHVHNYQRFTRAFDADTQIVYIVIGNSGYHNLHVLAPGAVAGKEVGPGVTFEAGDDQRYGFLRLDFDGPTVTGTYNAVQRDGTIAARADTWSASC